jgi:hypothetical protein
MKTLPLKAITPALIALALAGASDGGSAIAGPRPDPKKDYAKSGASAAASASAPPQEEAKAVLVDGHKPWAPTFAVTVPETASDPPAKEEWESAAVAKEVRVLAPGCEARRIREWYRILCKFSQRIEVISGGREGVSFGRFFKDGSRDGSDFADLGWVIFPARRGDRRAFEVFTWVKWGLSADTIITEQFLEGDAVPWISVHGLHWGF